MSASTLNVAEDNIDELEEDIRIGMDKLVERYLEFSYKIERSEDNKELIVKTISLGESAN